MAPAFSGFTAASHALHASDYLQGLQDLYPTATIDYEAAAE